MIATSPIADVIASIPEVVVDIEEVNSRDYYYEVERLIEFGNHAVSCNIEIDDDRKIVDNITFYSNEDVVPLTAVEEELIAKQIETKINVA